VTGSTDELKLLIRTTYGWIYALEVSIYWPWIGVDINNAQITIQTRICVFYGWFICRGVAQGAETGIGGVGNKKVTSKCYNRYQQLDGEACISCRWQQVSAKSLVIWSVVWRLFRMLVLRFGKKSFRLFYHEYGRISCQIIGANLPNYTESHGRKNIHNVSPTTRKWRSVPTWADICAWQSNTAHQVWNKLCHCFKDKLFVWFLSFVLLGMINITT
jgi:hypothetical protein